MLWQWTIDKFDPRILSWSLPWSVTQSLTLSTIFLPNERENILVSSVCGSVGIKYSSQILQSCSKLGWSFRHSVSFQCLFRLRNFYNNYFVSCHLFLYLNWTNISLMDTSLVVSIFISFFFLFFSIQIRRRGVSVHCRSKCQSMESIKSLFNSNTTFSTFVSVSVMF